MKRTTVAALAALTLAGCAAPAADPAPEVTVTAPAPTVTITEAPPEPEPEPTLDLVDWMDYQAPDWRDYGTTGELRDLADIVCESLDYEIPMADIADIVAAELPTDVGAAIIVGAVALQCPEHQDDVDGYAS